jgi:CheY-like chemotaxis protein
LNRKIVRKILESAEKSILPECVIHEADDGSTAIEKVKSMREMGVEFDFILIDFVMVMSYPAH